MSLKIKFDFPVNLLPSKVIESKILYPVKPSIGVSFTGDFIRILMEKLRFPFIPHMQNNETIIVLFNRQTKNGQPYVTQELKTIQLNESNVHFVKSVLDSEKIGNIYYYNNVIFTILLQIFNIKSDGFAIYGRDINGRFGYLTFEGKTKIPVMHYIKNN